MLTHDYSFYFLKLAFAALFEPFGLLAIVFLCLGSAAWVLLKGKQWRLTACFSATVLGLIVYWQAFGNAIYEYDEQPETLVIQSIPAGEPDCGTAWTGFIKSGYGVGNPCPAGCYRGIVLRKQLRMRGLLPPWPEYRREMQCWIRSGEDKELAGLILGSE